LCGGRGRTRRHLRQSDTRPSFDISDAHNVVVTVTATSDVNAVHGQVDGIGFDLARSPNETEGTWRGSASLPSVSRGVKTLVVTATDITGLTGRASTSFFQDARPILMVTSPAPFTVATSKMRVAATCTDDEGGCQLKASFGSVSVAGTEAIDTTLSLSGQDGLSGWLSIMATDSGVSRPW